jgi:hypothetical protein
MKVALGGGHTGTAIDVPGADGARLAAAVADPADGLVECPEPGPAHEYAGHVRPGMAVPVRAAVAAAARSRGASTPFDRALAEVETALAGMPAPDVDLAAERRRLAAARETETELRDRVARLAGRVEVLRERDADADDAERRLEAATRELTEAETERVAAEQSLDRARREAREVRDARERRLELEDRAGNLRRAARDHLAEEQYVAFAAAVRAVPGEATPGDAPTDYDGDAVTAALAVARMADTTAPVVLDCDRFDAAAVARERLDAAVIRV